MKKTNVKTEQSTKKDNNKKLKYESITRLVIHLFNQNPAIKSKEMETTVKRYFPKSKFHNTHFSWFKYQIKAGRYDVKSDTLKSLKS